ncbi:response regulator transcription factor [Rhodopirellula sp.]|nr:response regulator transcription factor [bacterium]MDB4476998.1 response regulator transcription factor [Rhodopirellula sp.]
MSWNVLIVDDHEVARIGLSWLLDNPSFHVAGSVATAAEALQCLADKPIDLVVLDLRLSDGSGLKLLEEICNSRPEIAVVVLSAYENPTYIARAAALGAADYLLKSIPSQTLLRTLQRILKGNATDADSLLFLIQKTMQETVDVRMLPSDFPLTAREAQVLRHVALGLSNKEIAKSLCISIETVKEHVQHVLRKINAADRTDAAVRAIKSGIMA